MDVTLIGPSRGLVEAFETAGATVSVVEEIATRDELTAAGGETADVVVLTDVEEASAVPVIRKLNPGTRVVIYDGRSMPDFVRGQVDLAVDPDLLEPEVVVDELSGDGAAGDRIGSQ